MFAHFAIPLAASFLLAMVNSTTILHDFVFDHERYSKCMRELKSATNGKPIQWSDDMDLIVPFYLLTRPLPVGFELLNGPELVESLNSQETEDTTLHFKSNDSNVYVESLARSRDVHITVMTDSFVGRVGDADVGVPSKYRRQDIKYIPLKFPLHGPTESLLRAFIDDKPRYEQCMVRFSKQTINTHVPWTMDRSAILPNYLNGIIDDKNVKWVHTLMGHHLRFTDGPMTIEFTAQKDTVEIAILNSLFRANNFENIIC